MFFSAKLLILIFFMSLLQKWSILLHTGHSNFPALSKVWFQALFNVIKWYRYFSVLIVIKRSVECNLTFDSEPGAFNKKIFFKISLVRVSYLHTILLHIWHHQHIGRYLFLVSFHSQIAQCMSCVC